MSELTHDRDIGETVKLHIDGVLTVEEYHHASCVHLLRLFWHTTLVERPEGSQPLGCHAGHPHKNEVLQIRGAQEVPVVHVENVQDLPLPAVAAAVYAQPMQVSDAAAEEILEASGIEVNTTHSVADRRIAVDAVEQAYDERQDVREDHESEEHTPVPRVARTPPNPLPRDITTTDAPTNLDYRAFVDVGIREESLQYHGAPWMIHEGFDIQMAAIHLAPHEQLGMEQHIEGVQVLYVLDGNLVVHVREPNPKKLSELTDVFYRCGAGQVVVIPRGAAHNVLNQADDLHARAWHFYAPRVHPEESGVYAEKYHDDNAPSDFHLQTSLTPEGRGISEATQLFDALLHTIHSQVDGVIYKGDDVSVRTHVVRSDSGSVLAREGYYYVVAGRGEVFNHNEQLGQDGVSRSKSKTHRPTPLVPGSIFYILPNSFAAAIAYEDDTSMHILAATRPAATTPTSHFSVSDDTLPAQDESPNSYMAPHVFVSEVLNAAPIAPGDIQEVNLHEVMQRAMDLRRAFIKHSESDEDEESDGDREWGDE